MVLNKSKIQSDQDLPLIADNSNKKSTKENIMTVKQKEEKKKPKSPKFTEFFDLLSEDTIAKILDDIEKDSSSEPMQYMIKRIQKYKDEKQQEKIVLPVFFAPSLSVKFMSTMDDICKELNITKKDQTIEIHLKGQANSPLKSF